MAIGKRAATGESSLVPGLTSIILFLLIPYFDRGLQWLITRYFEDKEEEEEIPPADTAAEEIPPADTAGDEGIPSAGGSADVATAESVPAEAAAVMSLPPNQSRPKQPQSSPPPMRTSRRTRRTPRPLMQPQP
jgi:hypothetical protein